MKLNKIFSVLMMGAALAFAACGNEAPEGPGSGNGSGTGTGNGSGTTASDTLTVSQAIAKQDNAKHFVKGVIVGWYSNHNNDKKVIFTAEASADTTVLATNLVIAESADETDQTKCICVQLSAGPIRSALNLKDHADNFHKELLIKGTLTAYNTMAGLKEPEVAYLDGAEIKNTIGQVEGAAGAGTEADPFNVAGAINKCIEIGTTASADEFYIQGTVKAITEEASAKYGNVTFTMVDAGKNDIFTVYRAKGPNGAALTEPVCKAGDMVVVKGKLVNYAGNTPELTTGGQVLSVNGKALEIVGDTTPVNQTGKYASSIAWTNGTNAYNDGKGTVNGEENVVIYKLSTSKAGGNATLTIPSGVSKIGFYAVAWKGATNTVLKVGEAEQAVPANDGATGNSPYTLTVDEKADYYEFNVTPGSLTISCDARVLIFAITSK